MIFREEPGRGPVDGADAVAGQDGLAKCPLPSCNIGVGNCKKCRIIEYKNGIRYAVFLFHIIYIKV